MVLASAVIFSQNGDPQKVLRIGTAELPAIGDNQILLKTLVSTLNPSDVSTVEGTYPSQPTKTTTFSKEPAGVVGNEAIFEVVEVGKSVTSIKVGDWARPNVKALGSWRTHLVIDADKVTSFPHIPGIAPAVAATMMINPVTAYHLLRNYATLDKGDWVIQNVANSTVGRAVIQLSKHWGYKTINVVRERPDLDALKSELKELGATAVITDKELESSDFLTTTLPKITGSEKNLIKLGLDAICGTNGTALLNSIAARGHFVVYGCLSKTPIQLGPAPMIFRNVTIHGYWLSVELAENPKEFAQSFKDILTLFSTGAFKAPPVEENVFKVNGTEKEKLDVVLDVFAKQEKGYSNKKQVLVYK